ncbi:MAG: hypothetical protein IT236_03035 [Bacteroidia bacterium]|nr:hypothetical protein [Bacteroidia bacterium]
MKKNLLLLLCWSIQIGQAQVYDPFTISFYKQFTDSLLWESPLKPAQVIKEGIKEVKVSIKTWGCSCEGNSIECPQGTYTCGYFYSLQIYTYDSLGFPTKLVIKQDTSTKNLSGILFANTYNAKAQLVNTLVYFLVGNNNDTSKIKQFTIKYNEENQIQLLQEYTTYTKQTKKWEFKYIKNKNGYEQQVNEFIPVADTFQVRKINKLYDTKNRIINDGFTYYLYDIGKKNLGLYQLPFKNRWTTVQQINLGTGANRTIVIRHYPNSNKIGGWVFDRKIEQASEIKGDKKFLWDYRYRLRGVMVTCTVSDLKTGLPIQVKKSYSVWPMQQIKYVYKFIRFKRVKFPPKQFRFEFPPQPHITEFTFTKR